AYTSDDLELLAAVADLAAVALDNARYVEETERRRREAERLEEIGRALSASLELPQVLERIIAAAVDLVEADSATVWLLRGETEVEIAMTGGRLPLPVGARVPLPVELCRRFLESRAGIAIDHVKKHPLLPPELRRLVRSDSGMVVPLLAEDQVIGALSIGHRAPREYRQEDVRLLERVSFHAAIAVANARLHERIRTLSLTDPLTGLPNRRHLEMFVEKEFAAARRGRRLAIVLFDLDHFKVYNDRAGHQAGDKALRAFADILASETRAMNLSARYGGDEFIAVLADSDRRGGLRHIARIAQAVERDPLLGPAGIRASAGVASYSAEVGSAEELIRAADRDLYRRKGSRNQHIPAS
ncbi:MAG: sensor domain-containing diguanylate cyclase, partial [Gemmatimonadetes bacterium]|nr:sensor domain-containing diguanylate cyclase [Gemmatimonadota bacterium]